MTKRLTPQEKKARKPALRACTFCHSKHLQCNNTRPCVNCVKRNIGHECHDATRKRAKYMAPEDAGYLLPAHPSHPPSHNHTSLNHTSHNHANHNHANHASQHQHQHQGRPGQGQSLSPYTEMDVSSSISTVRNLEESPSPTPSTTATNFNSNFLNQEYMMLSDLLLRPLSPSSFEYPALAPPPLVLPNFLSDMDNDTTTRPFIALGHRDDESRLSDLHFDNTTVDKPQYVLPLVSHHIYQTVQDIYSNKIINFDYPLSYHLLTFFLKERFSVNDTEILLDERARKRNNLLIILKLIASYRPTFISAHKSLFQPFDFQFLEMSFQRCLLDYENLLRLNASPTIIWRRTGEIVSISNDLVGLLGLSISTILSKRTFIMELMYDDESIVEYFRLFKSVAVGNLHLTIVTRCKLIKLLSSDTRNVSKTNTKIKDVDFIEFSSVWTVKRDLFDLPMVIVGQFLPVLMN